MQFTNPTAAEATNATNATNITGGGTASGSTVIAGELVIGDPNAAHVVIGSDGAGADGVRLYGDDGVTALIDLNIGDPQPVAGGNLQTRSRPTSQPDPLTNQGGATHAVITSTEFAGNPCWHVNVPAMGSGIDYYKGVIHADNIPVQPGIPLVASAWVFDPAGGPTLDFLLRITEQGVGFGYLTENDQRVSLTGSGQWQRVVWAFTPQANCLTVEFSTQETYDAIAPRGAFTYMLYGLQLEIGIAPTAYAPSAIEAGANLTGGGTVYGQTTISGELIVGNPAAAHVVIGTDANGADGVRLYGADGVTPLIDLNISSTPTIIGAIIQTAATGKRVVLSSAATDRMSFYTGDSAETFPALAQSVVSGAGNPNRTGNINLQSPNFGHGVSQLALNSAAADNSTLGAADLIAGAGAGIHVEQDITLTPRFGGHNVVVQGGDFRAGNVITTGAGAQFQFDCRDGSDNYIWYSPTTVTGARLYRVAASNDIFGINQQGGASFGRIDAAGIGTAAPSRLFMSNGAPPNGAGSNGDFCLRYDTPGTANQRLYARSAGAWVGII